MKHLLLIALIPSLALAGGNSHDTQTQELINNIHNTLKAGDVTLYQPFEQRINLDKPREFVGTFAPRDTCGVAGGFVGENNYRQGAGALLGCTWSVGTGSRKTRAEASLLEFQLHNQKVEAKQKEILFQREMELYQLKKRLLENEERLISEHRAKQREHNDGS